MLTQELVLKPGVPITSPGGRTLEIGDIFVPRHDLAKSARLPSAFRHLSRKVVVFKDGSIAPLAEVKRRFHPVLPAATHIPPTNDYWIA